MTRLVVDKMCLGPHLIKSLEKKRGTTRSLQKIKIEIVYRIRNCIKFN